jgi:asparagine synthase (glutamine-hydrolysing)
MHRAQYLEISIFLSEYLLSSQGDRMAMAHSVEGRFPFLDPRILEFCNSVSPELKLRGLNEKYILKQLAKEWLPDEIWKRPKKPYRAPIQYSFFNTSSPDYVQELLSSQYIDQAGFFNSTAVKQMVKKIEAGHRLGETDNMALAGILSTMLLFQQFITDYRVPPPLSIQEDVKVCKRYQQTYRGA